MKFEALIDKAVGQARISGSSRKGADSQGSVGVKRLPVVRSGLACHKPYSFSVGLTAFAPQNGVADGVEVLPQQPLLDTSRGG
jgi:hypothetical protein